jgi:hypothetical protein
MAQETDGDGRVGAQARSIRPSRIRREAGSALTKARPDLSEIGSSGLYLWGGVPREEFLPQLQGQQARRVYREMRDNDPVVGATQFAISMLVREVPWQVESADDSPEAQEARDLVDTCLHDMSETWEATLSSILSMLVFGWSFHEIVYKMRGGDVDDPKRRSKYDDNRIGWRKLALRRQESLLRWEIDENGGLQGMTQITGLGTEKTLPIDKAMLFRTDASSGNPEGRSVLRNAYRPWYMKKRIEEIEGVGIERDLAGLPIAYVPTEYLDDNADPQMKAVLEVIKGIVVDLKRDDQEGVVFPMVYDDSGNQLFKLELLTTGGRRQFDTDAIIGRYDQRLAMTILADFILLGHEKVGSFALGGSKMEMFSIAVGAWLDEIASVFNDYGIPRLMRYNGISLLKCPFLTHEDVKEVDLKALAVFVLSIAQAGAPLFPDDDLENWLRSVAGLPPKPTPAGSTGGPEL